MNDTNLVIDLLEQQEFKQWVLSPSSESNYFWETWMEKSEERKKAALSAREIILRVRFKTHQVDDSWKANLLDEIIDGSGNGYEMSAKNTSNWFWKVAAVVLLLIVAGLTLVEFSDWRDSEVVSVNNSTEWITRSNPSGQKSRINLPDGSVVNLNANSTLKYRKEFNRDRYLELEGEAFFQVEKDVENPFRVNSGSVVTTALGTQFNINTNTGAEKITLVEGKVRVEALDGGHSEILDPYEEIYFKKDTGLSDKSRLNSIKSVQWMDGVIYFNDSPLGEVVNTLENWYAVDITVIGNPESLIYSGEFQNENLSNILQSMKFSLGIAYEIEDKNVQLKFNSM